MTSMLPALLLCLLLMPDATALWQAGRREEALAARQQELIARPGDAALRLECARWQLDVHRAQAALATLQELGKEADSLRGEAYYKLAQYESAVGLLDATEPEGLLRKLDALEALMRFEESDALLKSAPRALWDSDARVWSAEGRRLARQREYPRAIEAFERALRIDPADGEALFGLGRAQIAAGEREKGLATLARHRELLPKLDAWDFARRAVDLAPRHAANLAALADAERELSRFERAEALYRTALDCAQSTEERVPIALRFARYWSESRRDAPRALALLQELAKSNPDARLWVRAGDLAVELKRTDDALRCYREALGLRPQDEAIRARIAKLEGPR